MFSLDADLVVVQDDNDEQAEEAFQLFCQDYYHELATEGRPVRGQAQAEGAENAAPERGNSVFGVVQQVFAYRKQLNEEAEERSVPARLRLASGQKLNVPLEFVKLFTKVSKISSCR